MWARKYAIAGVSFAVTIAAQGAAGPAKDGAAVADEFAADVVPEETLRDMRGGMDLGGLVGYFAIDRVVQVDGEVVAKMQIVVTNLDRLSTGGMPTISVSGPLAELVQVMDGVGVPAASPASAENPAASEAEAAPELAQASSSLPEPRSGVEPRSGLASASSRGAASGAPPPATAVATGVAAAAQSAALAANPSADISKIIPVGNLDQYVVVSNLPNAAALTTAIQNSVNGTKIQTETSITVSLNSLTALNGLALANSIQQQIGLALHH